MLVLEFIALFFVVPTLVLMAGRRIPALPILWVISAGCLLLLLRDSSFDRRELWDAAILPHYLGSIFALWGATVALAIFLVRRWAPATLFAMPRSSPRLWLAIMCAYPIVSVYPQGIVFRAFLVHRYGGLFPHPALLVLASATAFAYMHIVFRNGWAVGLTFLGGLIFATRFLETHSLFVSSFEHALYGCLMFTVGLGAYFHHGSAMRAAA